MATKFQKLTLTETVRRAQEHYYGKSRNLEGTPENDPLTEDEIHFIQARDSFYMATVSETAWPYIQHRGGQPGFLHVLSPTTLAFADYKGNRQLLSAGNLAASDRVALFLMDYPQRTRLKILGHARVKDAREYPDLVAQLASPEAQNKVERLVFIEIVSFDWNCPQYIVPRYTIEEMKDVMIELQQHIAELNTEIKSGASTLTPR
jgi:predicted pyridoxine 5'-phosphate oxidase superfamily flavin-nucleotide-binding protein